MRPIHTWPAAGCAPAGRRAAVVGLLVACVLIATAPSIVQAPSASAADVPEPDGLTAATAAASCWEVKQHDADAESGVYWLLTPALVAPQQFYCDQETDGGGWVLIGRGRENWKENYQGLRSPELLRNVPDGPEAFAPAQLPALTVDALLNNGRVDDLIDGIRLRRATNSRGTDWQEVRFWYEQRDRWVWTFGASHPVARFSFDGQTWSGGTTRSFGVDNRYRLVRTDEAPSHWYRIGFAYASQVTGSTSDSSYLWAPPGQGHARPFTQMFLRPRLEIADLDFGTVPAAGLPAVTLPAQPESDAMPTVWGVSGLANGRNSETSTEVAAFGEIDGKVYVGGNFRYVQRTDEATGADRVEQPYLAAFDVDTGELVSTFRPQLDGQVKAIIGLPDGRLAIGGQFRTVNGQSQSALAILDPDTGRRTGWQVTVENRMSGGLPYVRDFDVQGGYLYVAGALTHLVGAAAGVTGSSWNGGRIDLSTGRPDTDWNVFLNGTSMSVDASVRGDRVYLSGYFKQKRQTVTPNAVALQTTDGAPLVQPVWRPKFSHTNDPMNPKAWQNGIVETEGRVWVGGSQHSLFSYDREGLEFLSGSIAQQGGDFQTVTAHGRLVFAGCHCGDWIYHNATSWPAQGWNEADTISLVGAWDADSGDFLETWSPLLTARQGYGVWATFVDSTGVVWVGGDIDLSVQGHGPQWSGGFARYAPRDTSAPTRPGPIQVTKTSDGTVRLSWAASSDARGGVTYEVIRGNRVVATTAGTNVDVPVTAVPTTYVVRARDAAGNRSASTATVTVTAGRTDAVVLVAEGQTWSWVYTNDPWPDGWNDRGYDDSSWNSGDAPFGVGVAGLTELNEAAVSPRPLSAQFRREFTVAGQLTGVQVTVIANDGVVVYVNGTEVGREAMRTGTLGHNSYATRVISHSRAATNRITFDVPAALLVEGSNVIAVSTHANYRATRDISFELSMVAQRVGDAP